ncbi:PIN domain-containing protein [Brachybacterium huguangmaarense]
MPVFITDRGEPAFVLLSITDHRDLDVSGQHLSTLHVSALTLTELRVGILRLERRDAPAAAVLRTWFDTAVLRGVAGRVLPVDDRVALAAADLQVPSTRPVVDGLIAATALVHAMTVVTRKVADLAPTGVRVVDPWAS